MVTRFTAESKIMNRYSGSFRLRSRDVMIRRGRIWALMASIVSSDSNGFEAERDGNSPSAKPGAKIHLYSRKPNECGLAMRTRGTPGGRGIEIRRSAVRRLQISDASFRKSEKLRRSSEERV